MSEKKSIVRSSESQRKVCTDVIGKLKRTAQKKVVKPKCFSRPMPTAQLGRTLNSLKHFTVAHRLSRMSDNESLRLAWNGRSSEESRTLPGQEISSTERKRRRSSRCGCVPASRLQQVDTSSVGLKSRRVKGGRKDQP